MLWFLLGSDLEVIRMPQKPRIIHHPKYGLQVEYDPLVPHYGNYFEFNGRKQIEQERKENEYRGTEESAEEV